MDEGSFLKTMTQTLTFETKTLGVILDNYDNADPFRRADEFDDEDTAPQVNMPFYDTSISTPQKDTNMALSDLPDYSDKILSDYKIQKMLGRDVPVPNFVDLDTSDTYAPFIQNTIKNVLASEGEFLLDSKSLK